MEVEIIGNDAEKIDAQNKSVEAAKLCDGTCVSSLLGLVDKFGRAERLGLSSKSNLGA